MSYECVPYRPEFRDQIIRLQTHLWGSDLELNAAYFAWKYERNPYSRDPVIFVTLCDGEVVAMRGFHGAQWRFGQHGTLDNSFCACDLVVAPAHRKQGIHREVTGAGLRELGRRGHRFVFNLSANPANYISSLRAGWRLIGPFATVRRETTRGLRAQRWKLRVQGMPFFWKYAHVAEGVFSGKGVAALDTHPAISTKSGALTVSRKPNAQLMTQIAQRSAFGDGFGHVRTPEFFEWRFQNPVHDYRFVTFMDADGCGYLILQGTRGARRGRVNIVDWQASDGVIRNRMIETIVRLGVLDSVATWSVCLPAEMTKNLLRTGFDTIDESRGVSSYRPGLLIKPLDEISDDWTLCGCDIANIDNWNLRMVDSDTF